MSTPPAADPILYSFRRCPYAIRARLALATAGVRCELREVVLKRKPPELLAASPKGTVPVLVLPGGEVIDESLDIMRWALAQADPAGWLGGDPAETAAFTAWVDGDFKAQVERYKYFERYPEKPKAAHRDDMAATLAALDARIAAAGGAVLPGGVRLADAAAFSFVRQAARVDSAWFEARPTPALHAWYRGFADAAVFAAVMKKYKEYDPARRAAQGPDYFGG